MALFWCSCSFFTITPCDKWRFCVRLYATCHEHKLPSIDNIKRKGIFLLDFNARNNWREKYIGACAIEYESVIQVVVAVLIGHNLFYIKIAPFKYHPKRNIGDQFMNTNNDITTTVLACNNNVTIGDKACFFYVTLYQTNHNQK